MGTASSNSMAQNVPKLTLTPNSTASASVKSNDLEMEFSQKELMMAEALVPQIDIFDLQLVSTYGIAPQKRLAESADEILKQVKSKDLGGVGRDIEELLQTISGLKTDDPNLLSKIGFIARKAIEELILRYSSAQDEISRIVRKLEEHQLFIMQDMNALRKLKKANSKAYKELSLYIFAGQKKLQMLEQTSSKSDLETQKAIERFRRKLVDLMTSRNVALQTLAQIELLLNNDQAILEKISTIIHSTIPLWKNQIVVALGISDAMDALSYVGRVSQSTSTILGANQDKLKQLSSSMQRESKRRIVDIEALNRTNAELEETISEIRKIQQTSTTKRKDAELDLQLIEKRILQDLK